MLVFVRKYIKPIVLSAVVIVLSFGWNIITDSIRIDSEHFINNPGSTYNWLQIGRYGLVLLKRILGLEIYNAFKMGIMGCFFYGLAEYC